MLEDVTRTQAPEMDGGTRTFGGAAGTASFPIGAAAVESVSLPSIPGFEALELVGRGGMGLVFKARQLATGRIVALKMIVTGELANTAARDRFRSEITATAKLSHPHIVQLFEAGEADGRAFLVCEYVEGGSLASRLDGTPWDAKRAARMIVPIARAVASAHAAGIVHRDLKPANILLDTSFSPKLADFGIAKQIGDAADAATHTGAILGTPSYMAPEQAGGAKSAGPAADVYGLGAILYELITGRPPFKGADFVETLDQVRRQEPVSPRILQPKLPRDIETICLKCLQKDPAKRYATADALAEDLQRFLEHKPIAARPVSGVERAWRWTKRNPAVSGLLAAAFLILTAGVIVSAFFAYRAESERRTADGERRIADDERNKALDREKEANAARASLAAETKFTRGLLYASQMNAASVALAEGRIPRLLQLLEETTPKPGEDDPRGWEWHYLDRLTRPQQASIPLAEPGSPHFLTAFPAEMQFLQTTWAMSLDGSRFVWNKERWNDDRTSAIEFHVYDVAARKRLDATFMLEGNKPIVNDQDDFTPYAVMSKNGSELATIVPIAPGPQGGRTRHRMMVWNAATGERVPAPDADAARINNPTTPILRFDDDALTWLELEKLPQALGFGFPASLQDPRRQFNPVPVFQEQTSEHYTVVRWDRRKSHVERVRFKPGAADETGAILNVQSNGFALFTCFSTKRGLPELRLGEQISLTMELWDLRETPKRVLRETLPQTSFVAISSDGECVATLSGSRLMLLRRSNGTAPALSSHTIEGPPESLRLAGVSDSGLVALVRPNTILAVELRSGPANVRNFHHRDGLLKVAQFRPGTDTLVTLGGDGPSVREWNLKPVKAPSTDPKPNEFEDRSPDGNWIIRGTRGGAPADQRSLSLIDRATGKERAKLTVPPGETCLYSVFVPERQRVLVLTSLILPDDQPRTSWHLFDYDGRMIRSGVPSTQGSMSGHFTSPRGRWLLETQPDELVVRRSEDGEVVGHCRWPDGLQMGALKVNPEETRILICAAVPFRQFRKPGEVPYSWVQSFELPSGRGVWPNPATMPWRANLPYNSITLELLGDRVLVGGAEEGQPVVWIGNAADGATIHTIHGPSRKKSPTILARNLWFDLPQRRVALAGGGLLHVHDLDTGEIVTRLAGFDDPVSAVAFSTDGRRIFTLTTSSRGMNFMIPSRLRILVWDAATGRQLLALRSDEPPFRNGTQPRIEIRNGTVLSVNGGAATYDGTPLK